MDLTFNEDSRARVDMNVVMTGGGQLVEVQGTGEHGPFLYSEMESLLRMARKGVGILVSQQRQALGELADAMMQGDSRGSAVRAKADEDPFF